MSREGRSRWGLLERFVIGSQENPMLERIRLIQTPIGGVYLHRIHREDLDPYEHDHPWNFIRVVLRGGYTETYTSRSSGNRHIRRWRPSYFPILDSHRIYEVQPGTVSLVIVGRKRRSWGFWLPTSRFSPWMREWVDYRDYLGLR